jgi:dihydrofolate synthase/folylpolyglutamate synthase
MVLGLERVEAALARLGDPHLAVPALHVAGTNGKGSTCAMLEAILREAGFRVGMTTSPHLVRFAERIRIDGEPIADEPFATALERALGAPEPLTFFESLTVAAFVAFADAKVDVAILETGLGGRLDATNVCRPLATAITSIGLDHQALLGDTLEGIAREKAGIAKANVPLVVGRAAPSALAAIRAVAADAGAAPIWTLGEEVRLAGDRVTLEGGPSAISARSSLEGAHQLENAAIALALARWTPVADLATAARGLERVAWPGRFERLRHGGVELILDGAHNADGACALAETLRGAGISGATLLFGAMDDKDVEGVAAALRSFVARSVLTEPPGRAPAPLARLAAAFHGIEAVCVRDPSAALRRALTETPPGGTLLVAGSLYLVGAIRAELLGVTPDPALGL